MWFECVPHAWQHSIEAHEMRAVVEYPLLRYAMTTPVTLWTYAVNVQPSGGISDPSTERNADMAQRSDDEYAEMSAAVEAGEYTVSGRVEMGRTLRKGRPVGKGPRQGASKSRSVRLSGDE